MSLLALAILAYLVVYANLMPLPGEPPQKRSKRISESRCDLQFSEIKLAWNAEPDVAPFIELKSHCPKRPGPAPHNAIKNYIMIVVQSEPLALAMVVTFENLPYDGTQPFIVIGSPEVPNVLISTGTPHIQSIFSRTDASKMFPIFDQHSYAAFLLQDLNKQEIKKFKLQFNQDGILVSRVLMTDQLRLIADTAVDMMFLGEKKLSTNSEFEHLWSRITDANPKFAQNWDVVRAAPVDMSLSYCNNDINGFDSEGFVLKLQSPGQENFCNIAMEIPVELQSNTIPTMEKNFDNKLLHSIPAATVQKIKNSKFDPNWIGRCQNHFPIRSKLLEQEAIQKWVQFNEDDSDCRFTCKTCIAYRSIGFRPDVKSKPKIVTSGFLSNDVHDNGNSIKAHLMYAMHDESTKFFDKISNSASEQDVKEIIHEFEENEKIIFNATMNIVAIAYAEIKAGLPFQSHETLMKSIRRIGANVGFIHHTADGAQAITKVIANSFRLKMLNYFVTMDQPFSIMVDSSTNFNMPFLAVYVQILEDNYPVTHFFSLIYMNEGETARAMTNSFIEQIKKDDTLVPGFEKFFKSRLAAFSSDGAAVMIGEKTSFKVFLSDYIERTVPNVVCLAHKLDSAYKFGIKPDKATIDTLDANNPTDEVKIWQYSYFQTYEKSSNELYLYFSSRGYKKWNHLLSTAEELGIVAKRFKYVYDIRWSESHYRALETIHHNYYAIVEDLDKTKSDRSSDVSSRKTAEQHYSRMTDKTYVLVMHEFLDILSTFKIASKKFQESSSTVVGKIEIVYNVLKSMQEYRDSAGSWMKDFLANCACGEICNDGDCTIDLYDDCTEITINGLKLVNNFHVVLPYLTVRSHLYDNLIAAVQKYFNLNMLEAFQVFNPHRINFQRNPHELLLPSIDDFYTPDPLYEDHQVYENNDSRFQFICGFYEILEEDCERLKQEWLHFLSCVILTGVSLYDRPDDSVTFWPWAMAACQDTVTTLIKNILDLIMVTPFSSSQVERGFSVMNSVKTKGRSRLDKDTLDSIMAVKINGPDVADFNVYEYTIEFLKQYARVDDTGMKGGRKPAQEKFPTMMKKSRLY